MRETVPQPIPLAGSGAGEVAACPDTRAHVAELFEQHRYYLSHYLSARGVAAFDLADVLQETFERFHRYAHRIEPARARSLLTTIARNLLIDRQRHRRVAQTDPEVDVEQLQAIGQSPEQQLVSERELMALNRAIEQLPPKCRRVFVMRKIHQMSQKAIAEKLGISVSTVEKQVATGMRYCREYLSDCGLSD